MRAVSRSTSVSVNIPRKSDEHERRGKLTTARNNRDTTSKSSSTSLIHDTYLPHSIHDIYGIFHNDLLAVHTSGLKYMDSQGFVEIVPECTVASRDKFI